MFRNNTYWLTLLLACLLAVVFYWAFCLHGAVR